MKKIALCLALVMAILLSSVPVFAAGKAGIEITPNSIPVPITIQFETDEVWGQDEVEVTVNFRDTSTRKVPFTVNVTNGAEILVYSISDVEFVSNGISSDIDSFDVSPDGSTMTLVTGICQLNKQSSFTFKVKAPLISISFSVTASADNTNPYLNGNATTPVLSGLTLEAPSSVTDLDTFTIYGDARWKRDLPPAGAYVYIEIVDLNDPSLFFIESQYLAFVENGAYSTGNTMHLVSNFPDGNYLIRAYLINPITWDYIGYAQKEIRYTKRPDVLDVSLERTGAPVVVKIDPQQGNGIRDGVYLTGVRVAIPTRIVYSWNNVTARVTMKYQDEIDNALNARFVVYTTYGPQYFAAEKIGKQFYSYMAGLKTDLKAQNSNLDPYVYLEYTYNNELKTIFVGFMSIIIDPAGNVVDAITGLPVQGAIVTLYKKNANRSWSAWQPPADQVNPKTTDATGAFEWDVEEGTYMIMVYHHDYNTISTQYSTLTDPNIGLIEIPPERADIIIRLPKQI